MSSRPTVLRAGVSFAIAMVVAGCSGKRSGAGNSAAQTPAQSGSATASTSRGEGLHAAVAHYQLTDENVDRTQKVMTQLNQLSKTNSEVAKTMERAAPSDSADVSVDEIASRLESIPETKAILSSAGISGKDFTLTLFTLMEAGPAYDMKKAGMLPANSTLAKDVSQANLDWVASHQDKVKAFVEASNRD